MAITTGPLPQTNGTSSNGTRSRIRPSGRQTQPTYYNPYRSNGLGIIARRGVDEISRRYLIGDPSLDPDCLTRNAATYPLRLLALIVQTHPLVKQAWSNNLRLAFAPGDTQFVALKAGASPGQEEVDDAGTAALREFWERCGGEAALQKALAHQLMCFGLGCLEAVPGMRGRGLGDVLTFDPLSCRFRQGTDEEEAPLILQQLQLGGWKDLPAESVFWAALDGDRDNPYGVPLFSAVPTVALDDLFLQRTIRDVLWFFAWPRLSVGFDLEALVKFAADNYQSLGLLPPDAPAMLEDAVNRRQTAVEWAVSQFDALKTLMETLKPSDMFIYAKGSEVKTLSGGTDLSGTEGVLQMQRHRLVMAVDQPPALLGITDGGTQAYTQTSWRIFVSKLEELRHTVNTLLLRAANLHLRLLGLPLRAEVRSKPIRTEEILTLAQAAQTELLNAEKRIQMGFNSAEEECVEMTGSGLADAKKAARIGEAPAVAAPAGAAGNGTQPG